MKLAVTTFVPVIAPASPVDEPKPIAGLSPLARVLWRDKRAKECEKREPALELNR